MYKHWLIALLIAPVFVMPLAANDGVWSVRLDESKAKAAEESKDLLIYISGSDWCPPCIQLHDKVLTDPAFLERAPKAFALTLIDYPQDTSKQDKAEMEQNERMKQTYPHRGVPTIILADAKGKPYYALYGYEGKPAPAFVDELMSQAAIRKQRDAHFAKAASAEGIEKAQHLDEGLSAVIEGLESSFNPELYGGEIAEIIKADADNQAGLKSKYEGIQRLAALIQEIKDIRAKTAAVGAAKTLESLGALLGNVERSDLEQAHIHYAMTFVNRRDGQADAALTHAKRVLELAPGTDLSQRIQEVFGF